MTEAKDFVCPKTGKPLDLKWTSKWSERLYLVFCDCGYVHEFVVDNPDKITQIADNEP